MRKYYPRLIEADIEKKLRCAGALIVSGPKFCGKTTTCMRFQKSVYRLDTRDGIERARLDPEGVLTGDSPRLLDEWQNDPDIVNHIKNSLDDDYVFGKYILTGSTTPASGDEIYHSGAGRFLRIGMRTMSLYESEESKGIVSISELLDNPGMRFFDANGDFSLSDVACLVCRGGWPLSLGVDSEVGLAVTKGYYDGLFVFENSKNERFRNLRPDLMRAIVRSYARNISGEASDKTITEDVKASTDGTLDPKTFTAYVDALKDIYVLEDTASWNPSILSKTAMRTKPIRHFVDTSIACSALRVSPADLMGDLEAFGRFFEDFAVRDLSIYAGCLGGEVRHYRDSAGLECDAVLRFPDGRWGAVEIKLGGERLIEEGADSLKRLKRKIEQNSKESSPTFMMVLTATGALYRREDGICVVPVNCLKP